MEIKKRLSVKEAIERLQPLQDYINAEVKQLKTELNGHISIQYIENESLPKLVGSEKGVRLEINNAKRTRF